MAGCAQTDPYQRIGAWQPSGVVDGNLAAMVADPRDLIRGHGDPTPEPHAAPLAVQRLWADKTKPFISDNEENGPAGGQSNTGSASGAALSGTN
jgi:hypothetical protein